MTDCFFFSILALRTFGQSPKCLYGWFSGWTMLQMVVVTSLSTLFSLVPNFLDLYRAWQDRALFLIQIKSHEIIF